MELAIAWISIFVLVQFAPTFIIIFSKRVKGSKKLRWIAYSLLPIILIPLLAIVKYDGNVSEVNIGYSYAYVWILLSIFILKNSKKEMISTRS